MSGIVGERLVKDILRASVVVRGATGIEAPSKVAFDQLERVEITGIVRFLKEANLLRDAAAKAAAQLAELRNQYAHARGVNAAGDALKAIKFLHVLVEDTVSILKDHELKDGMFVPKVIRD